MERKLSFPTIALGIALLMLACGQIGQPTPALVHEVTRVVVNGGQPEEVVVVEISPRPQVETIVVTVESPNGQGSQSLEGQGAIVTNVVDGDTIDVLIDGTSYRVRYIGMDTPERGDHFFREATDANRALVEGHTVILVKDVSETDRFGRLLRYVYLQDGTFVNAELVKQGYALIATFPPDVRYQDLFLELQEEARDAGRGLWADPQ